MSKQANPFLIGVFALGASCLLVIGLVLFGSGNFFREENNFISYFEGSVKGLKIGASVTFRGVKIGEVSDLQLQLDQKTGKTLVPVFMKVYPDKIVDVTEGPEPDKSVIHVLIDRGLRAQLEMESIVTGLLAVNLDYFPETEASFVGTGSEFTEIPTVPSIVQQLSNALEDFPIEDIGESLKSIVSRLDELLSTDDAEEVGESLGGLIENVQAMVKSAERFFNNMNMQVGPVSDEFTKTMRDAQEALAVIEATVSSADGVFAEDSAGRIELQQMIRSLKHAADKVSALAEYLERNPESLIRGRR